MSKDKKFTFRHLFSDRELSPEERRLVLEDLFVFGRQNRIPFLFRMGVLLVLSTIIATAGLLSDSAAVVIGAMLVAPLMTPVMAAAAVVMGWQKRFYSALWLVLAMGLGALLLSSLLTLLSPEIVFIPEQVLARTRPTYFDLLIALAAGAAGAYTITRKESNAIPGVAVAVALLPPLASAGILLTSGEYELATRAVVLFLTNLVAMILAAALTFLAVGVSPASARKRSAAFIKNKLYLFLVLTLSISVPLWFYTDKVLFNPHYLAAKSEVLQNWLLENELELTDVDFKNDTRTLSFSFTGPRQPLNIGDLYDQIIANGKL
ncbi:MAG: TIGR00341 family protein, partial [Xanthomonadales bacterium]|nr:TIGR00341 family protein [Xanthomonadales bacterium]